jgi:hypothetical protein
VKHSRFPGAARANDPGLQISPPSIQGILHDRAAQE